MEPLELQTHNRHLEVNITHAAVAAQTKLNSSFQTSESGFVISRFLEQVPDLDQS